MTIFSYQNYRYFLNDYLADKKRDDKSFSQRALLKKMGISSTGFLANVISGRNNLTTAQTVTLAGLLDLTKRERDYFEAIVLFTQAKTIEEKNRYFELMIKIHRSKFKTLSPSQLGLFSSWQNAVIREIIGITNFTGNMRDLAKMVVPRITEAEAKKAVEELEAAGLITKDPDGIYRQKSGTVTTGDEVKSLFVANFIVSTLDKAKGAIDTFPPEERDLSALTLRLSEPMMAQIKSEIKMFRKRILELSATDTNQNRVYQLSTNFFPVSEKGE